MKENGKKREHSEDTPMEEEVINSKRIKLDSEKSSIQILNELKQVQPVRFDILDVEGPPHMPKFKIRLSIRLNNTFLTFIGEGSNKKTAKSISAMRGLNSLIQMPEFVENRLCFKEAILTDIKNLKIDPNSIDFLTDETHLIQDLIIDEPKQISQVLKQKGSQIIIEIDEEISKMTEVSIYDQKTRDVIASKNIMSIWNHLVPNLNYNFNVCEEEGSGHKKLFKAELKLSKSALKELRYVKLDINSVKDSILVNEDENEFRFYGFGNNKKKAKTRSTHLALQIIFGIKFAVSG